MVGTFARMACTIAFVIASFLLNGRAPERLPIPTVQPFSQGNTRTLRAVVTLEFSEESFFIASPLLITGMFEPLRILAFLVHTFEGEESSKCT